jgi:hypothetical protein
MSRVARKCFHAETAKPPISATGMCSSSSTARVSNIVWTISVAIAGPRRSWPPKHPGNSLVVLFNLAGIPGAVGSVEVTVGADRVSEASEQ